MLLYFFSRNIEITRESASAMGRESHSPFTPMISGRIISIPKIKANVRKNEISAEILPFETEVKKMEEKIFRPENRNPRAKIVNADFASANTEEVGATKTLTI